MEAEARIAREIEVEQIRSAEIVREETERVHREIEVADQLRVVEIARLEAEIVRVTEDARVEAERVAEMARIEAE